MNNKNKVLKRQSQMILEKVGGLNVVEINFEDDVADADTDETEYYRKLDIRIQGKGSLSHTDCQLLCICCGDL